MRIVIGCLLASLVFAGCTRTEEEVVVETKKDYGTLTVAAGTATPAQAPADAYVVPHVKSPADLRAAGALTLGDDNDAVHGRAWIGYDASRLYLVCEVVDPNFRNTGTGGNASLENCVVFDFDGWFGTGRSAAERMTFALTRRGAETSWDILHREDPGECVIRRTGDTFVYAIALAWHDVQPIAPVIGATFGFDVLYQYLDDDGRRRCVRWQSSAGDNPARRKSGAAVLAPPDAPVGTSLTIAPRTYDVAADGTLKVPALVLSDRALEGATLSAKITEDAEGGATLASSSGPITVNAGVNAFDLAWNAADAPDGTYRFVVTLTGASGAVIASDYFRAHRAPALSITAAYEELKPLYEKLKSSPSKVYAKDADSVDVRMETLAAYAGKKLNATEAAQLQRIAANTREVLDTMLGGRDYFAMARGWVVYGFRSPYDDTLQPYEVFVPRDYDPSKPWPLIVHLHGAGGDDPLKLLDGTYTARYMPEPDFEHLQMMPLARGRSGYQGLGLTEVLDTIEYTKSRYHVDADRVSIKGFSMGGAGTWKIALAYPDLFAAANPRAGFVGYPLYDELAGSRTARDWKDAVRMTASPIFFSENANNLFISLYHGGSDPTIPVENTYRMWKRLTDLGGDYALFVYHARQHTWAKDLDPIQNADMLACRRDRFPARVIYRTNHLHFHRAWWVSVEQLANPLAIAEIDALAQSDGSITVRARDVHAFALALPGELVGDGPVTVIVNGEQVYSGEVPAERELFVEQTSGGVGWRVGRRPTSSDRVKQPGLSGPIDDAFYGRVLYVYGTQAEDADLNATLKQLARERCGLDEPNKYTSRKRHGFYPVKADVDVTADDMKHAHLVLLGGPEANAITAKIAADLPVKLEAGRFTMTSLVKTFDEPAHGVKFICPNPMAPGRYVIVTAANSVDGYRKTTDLRRNVPDWVVTGEADDASEGGIIEAGYFDNQWQ